MTLTKETVIDRKEILENGTIQIREATRILDDGKVISQTLHRYVLHPGADVTDQPQEVKDLAGLIWTPAVNAAYTASLPVEYKG